MRSVAAAQPQIALKPKPAQLSVLLVSERPEFIVGAQQTLRPLGVRVVGCLGPCHGPCYLDEYDSCPLAQHADVAIVDTPDSGSFSYHWKELPAGTYAEELARLHPSCFVVLCNGSQVGTAGASGEVAHVHDDVAALELVRSMATHPARRKAQVIPLRRKEER